MIVKCPKCPKKFENAGKWNYTKKFCSRKCANSREWTDEINERRRSSLTDAPHRICVMCSNRIRRKKFCSPECKKKYSDERQDDKVSTGKISNNRELRQYLVRNFGDVCVICDSEGFHMGKVLILQVDHIDGNRANNFPHNLRLLCPNCHTQTDTFGGRKMKLVS